MDRINIGHHISKQFNDELEDIRNKVLAMGGIVEQQLNDALSAVVSGDGRLGEVVITNDYKVNALEIGDGLDDGDDQAEVAGGRLAARQHVGAFFVDSDFERIDLE